jgi:hypothetical protein
MTQTTTSRQSHTYLQMPKMEVLSLLFLLEAGSVVTQSCMTSCTACLARKLLFSILFLLDGPLGPPG